MPTTDTSAAASGEVPEAQDKDFMRLARGFSRSLTALAFYDVLGGASAILAVIFLTASGGWLLALAFLPFSAIALYRAYHQMAAATRIRAGATQRDAAALGSGFEHLRKFFIVTFVANILGVSCRVIGVGS